MKTSSHNLYHLFLKSLKEQGIQNTKILVACSGGMDSISLLALLKEVSRPLRLQITVAYVHHGQSIQPYRNQSQIFVECLCYGWSIPFITNTSAQTNLSSEEDFRKYRYTYLNKWKAQTHSKWLALAHTADDLLETRLIRLIRGTGEKGFLSMSQTQNNLLRPLLPFTKKEIKALASSQNWKWIEDPSNLQTEPLRNWIRETWLKDLEIKHKGGGKNLSLSLERISQKIESKELPLLFQSQGSKFPLSAWYALPLRAQKESLARWMHQMKLKNYSENHIQEVCKRLRKKPTKPFRLLGKIWKINENFIILK